MARINEQMNALLVSSAVSRERKRFVYQFGELLHAVNEIAAGSETPAGTRQKAGQFLSVLAEKEREHQDEFLLEGFLLNFVGEAMVRACYIGRPVVEFLRTGLYFYGINHIERCHRRQSMAWMSAHAELLMDYTNRKGLKALVASGEERLAEGRPFCLVNDYLNTLKKRYWAALKNADDACDNSMNLEVAEAGQTPVLEDVDLPEKRLVDREVVATNFEDRVQIMLGVFARDLSETQQRVYLCRHPFNDPANRHALGGLDSALEQFLRELEGHGQRCWNWKDIAELLQTTEKTAKKQYLRALYLLLSGACDAIFQGRLPSGMVRRMLNLLRTIVQERDLRIRDHAGLGLGRIVTRWEVALRFVLNHDRIVSGSEGGGESFKAPGTSQ